MYHHTSVLLRESIDGLGIQPNGVYVDATFGGGGHSAAILAQLGDGGRLFAFDQDEAARQNATSAPFDGDERFMLVGANFRFLKRFLRAEGIRAGKIHGILADLGVSSHQLDTAERGFSYRFEAALDMRMDTAEGQTAADILNTYDAEHLQRVLGEYGEVRNARTLAQGCIKWREHSPFRNTSDLVALCDKHMMGERWRYLSQVFQALRMEVNDELGALADFLRDAQEMLAPGGRLAIITFHSLEDRMVKNFIKTGNVDGTIEQDFYGNITRPFQILTKKPIEASSEETKENARSRSAKLRIGIKTDHPQ